MTWKYNNQDFTEVPKGMEGFVYLITNLTNDKKYIGKKHVATLGALERAHTIILYGLSISPLDAELSQILGACFERQNIKRVIIVDLVPEVVAEKVNLLLSYPTDMLVHGYYPSDLTTIKDYSLY